jgi:hypothetical protein
MPGTKMHHFYKNNNNNNNHLIAAATIFTLAIAVSSIWVLQQQLPQQLAMPQLQQ